MYKEVKMNILASKIFRILNLTRQSSEFLLSVYKKKLMFREVSQPEL